MAPKVVSAFVTQLHGRRVVVVAFERGEPNTWIARMLELLPAGTEIDPFSIKMPVEPGEDAQDIHQRISAAFDEVDRAPGGPSSVETELARDAGLSADLQDLFGLGD